MSAAKHTPGPWTQHKWPFGFDVVAGNSDQSRVVASTCTSDFAGSEDAANARLIAAAPDLLQALVEASVALRFGHNSLVALEKAQAAIAKAAGEAA